MKLTKRKSLNQWLLPAMLGLAAASMMQTASAQTAANSPNSPNSSYGLCCDKTATGQCIQPMPNRPSASRVSEAGRYGDLYKRMDKLDTGNCAHAYYLHKTQAWLNLSREFYHEGDGSASVNAAYDEAEKLIKALEEGKTPSADTALILDANKLRPDLWQIAYDRKTTAALLSSAAREVAYCEVYLVRAGHAQANLGGKARVEPLIGMAQDICQAAKDKAPCSVPVPVIAPPAAVPAPVPPPAPVVVAPPPPPVVAAPVVVAPIITPPAPVIAPKRPVKQDRN
jgi:hypothetical protein